MPTTHQQYAEQEVTDWTLVLESATEALTALEAARTDTQTQLSAVAADLAAQEKVVAQAAATLAAAEPSTPTAVAAAALAAATATQRTLIGRKVELEARGQRLKVQSDAAGARASVARSALAAAEAALPDVREAQTRRTRWLTALRAAPLTTVKADATAIVDGSGNTLLADAEKKFRESTLAHVPDELYDAAEARFQLWWARQTKALAAATTVSGTLATGYATDGGKDGAALEERVAFDAAQAEASGYLDAADRLTAARKVLEALVSATGQALSDDESSRAAAAVPATAVLTRLGDVVTRQGEYDDAEAAYRAAARAVLAAKPTLTAAEVDADATVAPKKALLNTALGNLGTARSTATGAGDPALAHAWALTLTDATWRRLHDFFWARSTLEALKAADVSTAIATRLENAEGDWADAALEAAARARSVAFLESDAAAAAQEARAVTVLTPPATFAALRGDVLFDQ